jgi:hypothetical protein
LLLGGCADGCVSKRLNENSTWNNAHAHRATGECNREIM